MCFELNFLNRRNQASIQYFSRLSILGLAQTDSYLSSIAIVSIHFFFAIPNNVAQYFYALSKTFQWTDSKNVVRTHDIAYAYREKFIGSQSELLWSAINGNLVICGYYAFNLCSFCTSFSFIVYFTAFYCLLFLLIICLAQPSGIILATSANGKHVDCEAKPYFQHPAISYNICFKFLKK